MKRSLILAIILGLIFPLAVKAEEIALTLDEAIALALRDNRDILLKVEELKEAKFKIAEAEAGFLPTLNFTASQTQTRGYYTKDLGQTSTQATLKHYLYKGGKIVNTLRQNQGKLEVAQCLLDKTKLETVLSVEKAFYALLLSDGFVRLNKSILENTEAHLDFIKARYTNGQASESEVLNVEAGLVDVQQAYEESLNQLEAGAALLKNLLYLAEDVQVDPVGEFSYEPREVAFDAAFLKAMQNRPEIKQYQAQEEADKKAIEITKADNRPSVYASWDYYSRSHTGATPAKNWNDYNIIGLTFSWPIFDGWLTKAKVEQAILDLKETQLTKEKTIKDITLELKNAYLGLKNAIAKINSYQAELTLYKDKKSVAEVKYQAGQASVLDVKDIVLGYEVALFNQKQAIYDYLVAKAGFDASTAQNVPLSINPERPFDSFHSLRVVPSGVEGRSRRVEKATGG